MIGGEYDGIGTENLSGNLWETTTAGAGEMLLGVIGWYVYSYYGIYICQYTLAGNIIG